MRRCRPSAVVSAESFIFAHKAVIDAILATPPTPSVGLSADVSDFLKQFAVPEDLAPFDVGVGGRQILSVKPVVWLSPDGPKPGVCLIRLVRFPLAQTLFLSLVLLFSIAFSRTRVRMKFRLQKIWLFQARVCELFFRPIVCCSPLISFTCFTV